MRRFLLRATTALTMFVAMTGFSRAEPITVSIAAAIGLGSVITAGSTAAAVATFALTTAVSTGLSFAASILTAKSSASASGVQSEVQYGGDVPRQIPFGTCRVAGQFIYFCGVGEKNKTLHLVYALADWECDGLDHVYVDDVKKTLSGVATVGSEHARYQVQGYGAKFIVKLFRGTMSQTADSELVSASAGRATGLGAWTSNHKGHGVCYVSLILTFDEDLFQSGIPTLEWQLRGAKEYDRRLDSTAGGSGAQRWNDPTTWAFSKNPIIHEENYRRGFHRNGVRLLGMGVPGADLLGDHYVAAANVCDEEVTEGGGDVARYECSAIINDDAEYRVAIDTFMGACAGMVVEKSGLFGAFAGASQSSVKTFNTNDLIVGTETSFATKLPREELFNAVYGSFTKAAENWQTDSFAPVTNGTWEAEDNNERLVKELALPQVTSGYQASRIAKIVANRGRKQARHDGVYGPKYSAVEAGDWVTLVSRFGTHTMQVMAKKEVAPLQWAFAFAETHADVYGGAASAPSTPTIVQDDIPDHVTTISGFAISAVSIAGTNGQVRPGIKVDWTPPGDPSVVAVKIEYRVQGTVLVQPITVLTPLDGTFTIQSDLMAGTVYEVRARYMLTPDLTATWSSWLNVTTTSAYVVATSRIASDTQAYFDGLQAELDGTQLSDLYETLQRFLSDDNVRYSFSRDLQQVTAAQNASFAQVGIQMSALASDTSALAELLLTVEAKADGATAQGAFKMEALVTPEGGAVASIAAFVSADNGASYKRAGWRLDVFDEGGGVLKGRFVVEAEYFAIVQDAGGTPFAPFAVVGPDVYINRVVVADEIVSDNFDTDSDGNPAAGFRAGSDGLLLAEDARFTDMKARGGAFTGRPVIFAQPSFRNGVPEGLAAISQWVSPGNVAYSGLSYQGMLAANFHRTPDCISGLITQVISGSTFLSFNGTVFVPPGKRLPAVIPLDLAGNANIVELRGDGTIWRVNYTGAGGFNTENQAEGWWIYPAEANPLNLIDGETLPGIAGSDKVVAGLGFSRQVQFQRIPDFLLDGVTPVTAATFKQWGAGGAKDTGGGDGGPGGYIEYTMPVGAKDSAVFLKRGAMLKLIPGEGGKSKSADVTLGFGGPGQAQGARPGGGGGTFVFLDDVSIANLIGVAGGGGAASGADNGSPGGHASWAGGNGASGTDDEIFTGVPWSRPGSIDRAGGGGGRVGGGWLNGNPVPGRGGTNWVHASATAVTNSASAADVNGRATTADPPNTGDADYIAWAYCLGNAALVGAGKTSTTVAECGGNGLIVIEYS